MYNYKVRNSWQCLFRREISCYSRKTYFLSGVTFQDSLFIDPLFCPRGPVNYVILFLVSKP